MSCTPFPAESGGNVPIPVFYVALTIRIPGRKVKENKVRTRQRHIKENLQKSPLQSGAKQDRIWEMKAKDIPEEES
jgi:hypothetical protein